MLYYKRNSFVASLLSHDPFIVKSRSNDDLITNLNKDNYPVLFEGLHTTYPLTSHLLENKKVYVRTHNIEHDFYKGLGKSETNIFKKNFFYQEAKKLKKFEKILKKVEGVFTISPFEQKYFHKKYGDNCHYIPVFHNHMVETELKSEEKIILFHGNVAVSDNSKAAFFLINTYKNSDYKLVIASSFTNKSLTQEINKYQNISFVDISDNPSLNQLFEKTHINVLVSFQKTGIKLKLLNSLYQGKFIIANSEMIEDTGLEDLCISANTSKEFLKQTKQLLPKKFTEKEREKRMKVLEGFNPIKSAQKIVDIIF